MLNGRPPVQPRRTPVQPYRGTPEARRLSVIPPVRQGYRVGAATPSNPREPDAAENSPVRKAGFTILLIFVFFRFSLLHELLASKLHFDTYLLMVFGALTVLFTVLTGGVQRALQHPAGKLWIVFSCLIV